MTSSYFSLAAAGAAVAGVRARSGRRRRVRRLSQQVRGSHDGIAVARRLCENPRHFHVTAVTYRSYRCNRPRPREEGAARSATRSAWIAR